MSKGKLIVLEGLDGSGKATQAKLLAEHLAAQGVPVQKITFPDYASDSSALVKMYLAGQFGQHPDDVNAYAASSFYAVDRYASYKTSWGSFYEQGGVIIADRYTTRAKRTCTKRIRLIWRAAALLPSSAPGILAGIPCTAPAGTPCAALKISSKRYSSLLGKHWAER